MTSLLAQLPGARTLIVGGFLLLLALVLSAHAILHKRDSRAAVAWVGFIWLAPLVGGVLYVLFGVNRIRRRAAELRGEAPRLSGSFPALMPASDALASVLAPDAAHLVALGRLMDRITRRSLVTGNRLEPLDDGDQAYPAMLAAIHGARRSVALSTYIFDDDAVGAEFADALAGAQRRGVAVRVLLDAIGVRYSRPPVHRRLRRLGVPVALFLPTLQPWRARFFNLRNHRKILVADGEVGFTGGINIRTAHRLADQPRRPVRDLHFRVTGPVVRHLSETFAEDWAFAGRELLEGDAWFPELEPAGPAAARGISDGPDEDFEGLYWALIGAVASARKRILIATPYFVPDQPLIRALTVAALRGVEVRILMPGVNNLPVVAWAAQAQLWQVVKRDCEVRLSPGPFDHAKLMVVDDVWTLAGSANWDARSLRLNFEFNVEAYDPALAHRMADWFEARWTAARAVTARMLDGRPLWMQLRDGVARLAAPYL